MLKRVWMLRRRYASLADFFLACNFAMAQNWVPSGPPGSLPSGPGGSESCHATCHRGRYQWLGATGRHPGRDRC
jgi:hypothetical protein